jgi:titin
VNTTNTTVKLSFTDNSGAAVTYLILRKSGAGSFAQVGSVTAITGTVNYTFTDTGLIPNTAYTYEIVGQNAGGNSNASAPVAALTLPNVPTAPIGLSATVISQSEIDLAWSDTAGDESGFKVRRAVVTKGIIGPYVVVAVTSSTGTTFADQGLSSNTTYAYQVTAVNAGGESALSNMVQATTLPAPPAIPDALQAAALTSTSIMLSWTDGAADASSFLIQRQSGTGQFTQVATVAGAARTYTDTGLLPNTTYTYQIIAVNAGGQSSPSPQANATTLLPPPDVPTALVAVAPAATQVNLSWVETGTGANGFIIQRSTAGAGFTQIATASSTATSYADTSVAPGTSYTYRLIATSAAGNSAPSASAAVTTPPLPPAPPAGLTAVATSQTTIVLNWAGGGSGQAQFVIQRQSGTSGFSSIAVISGNSLTYSDTGLAPNTTYTYQVVASNTGGSSAPSNQATTATFPPVPATPTNFVAVPVSQTEIDLTWTDNKSDFTGFVLQRRSPTTGYTTVAQLSASTLAYADQNLAPNTAYTYQLFAVNTGGMSTPTAPLATATLPGAPAAPQGLTANGVSQAEIDLTWAAGDKTQTGFIVNRADVVGGVVGAYVPIATLGAAALTFKDTGVVASTTYSYQIVAVNKGGMSAPSNTVQVTSPPAPPTAVSNLTGTLTYATTASLSWTDTAGDQTGFVVMRKYGASASQKVAVLGPTATTFIDRGLVLGTTYTYQIVATNAGGQSTPSNAVVLNTPPLAPPAVGTVAATVTSTTTAVITWTYSATTQTGFLVLRAPVSGLFATVGTVGASVRSFTDTGLTSGTTYRYEVVAYNSGGNSSASNTATVTTLQILPSQPTKLVSTRVGMTEIDMSWTYTGANAVFLVQHLSGATWSTIATLAAGYRSYAMFGLTANTTYSFRIVASNAAGSSAPSNVLSVSTLPASPNAPGNLKAVAVGSKLVQLAWTEGSTSLNGFKIERRTGSGGFVTIATRGAVARGLDDTSVTGGNTYTYRVTAYNSSGWSLPSTLATVTTPQS